MKHKIKFSFYKNRHIYLSEDENRLWSLERDYINKGWKVWLIAYQTTTIKLGWFESLNDAKNFVRLIEYARIPDVKSGHGKRNRAYGVLAFECYGANIYPKDLRE